MTRSGGPRHGLGRRRDRDGDFSKRRQLAQPHDARLDELLRFEDAGPPLPAVGRPQPWLLRSMFTAFIASAVLYTLLHVFNLDPPYPLLFAICAGAVLVRRAVAGVAEPAWLRAAQIIRPMAATRRIESSGWYHDSDGMVDAVRRWDRRMDWGASGPGRFQQTVGLRLGELADERLRQRHGITRASDPARARTLLGEQIWVLVHGPLPQVPSSRQIAAMVDHLESI